MAACSSRVADQHRFRRCRLLVTFGINLPTCRLRLRSRGPGIRPLGPPHLSRQLLHVARAHEHAPKTTRSDNTEPPFRDEPFDRPSADAAEHRRGRVQREQSRQVTGGEPPAPRADRQVVAPLSGPQRPGLRGAPPSARACSCAWSPGAGGRGRTTSGIRGTGEATPQRQSACLSEGEPLSHVRPRSVNQR
jgi:hypothetical protein